MKYRTIHFLLGAIALIVSVASCHKNDYKNNDIIEKSPTAVIIDPGTVYVEEKNCYTNFTSDIILDGSKSSDPDNRPLEYQWKLPDDYLWASKFVQFERINPVGSIVRIKLNHVFLPSFPVVLVVRNDLGNWHQEITYIHISAKSNAAIVPIVASNFADLPFSPNQTQNWLKFPGKDAWVFEQRNEIPRLHFFNYSDKKSKLVDIPNGRLGYSLTKLNDDYFLIGGGTSAQNTWDYISEKTVESYHQPTGTWKKMGSLNTSRSYAKVHTLGQTIVVGGGYQIHPNAEFGLPLSSIESFDPVKNQWSVITPPDLMRTDFTMAVNNGKLYVCGGVVQEGPTQIYSDRIDIFDETTRQWSNFSLPDSIGSASSSVSGPFIFLYGFSNKKYLESVHKVFILDTRDNSVIQHCLEPTTSADNDGLYLALASKEKAVFINRTYDYVNEETKFSFNIYDIQTKQWTYGLVENTDSTTKPIWDQFWTSQDQFFASDGKKVWSLKF